jgi:hypothetical protein
VSVFDLNKYKSSKPATEYVTAHGKRIAVETLKPKTPAPKRRKPFKMEWVQMPKYWMDQLERHNSVAMYRLAHRILGEAFKCRQTGGEIVLSTEVTGLTRQTRAWATKKMVKAKLIRVQQVGNRAVRVTHLLHMPRSK